MKRQGQIDVVWCGHVFAAAGFDDELRNFLASLDAHSPGVNQTLIPLNKRSASFHLEPRMESLLRRLTAKRCPGNAVFLLHLYMANIASLAGEKKFFSHPEASGAVIRTTFEPDRLLPEWVEYLNRYDEVWVPSYFNKMTFSASGVSPKKLVRIPESIDADVFDPVRTRPLPGLRRSGRFVFLSILPANKQHLRLRKGVDILLRAYMNEFKPDEGACLMFHLPSSGRDRQGDLSFVAGLEKDVNLKFAHRKDIVFHRGILSNIDMPRLYRCADAFVLPSRSEGWGRLYMEAMAMGLPTLGTRWSGNLDFMNDRNSYLIDCRLADIPPTADMPDYWRHKRVTMKWAQPFEQHLQDLMRFVFKNRDAAGKTGQRARRDIAENYDGCFVARLIEKNLRRFAGRRR